MLEHQTFFDIVFTTGSIAEIRGMIATAARAPRTTIVVTPNVDHIIGLAERLSPEQRQVYSTADYFVCDSKIIGRLARWRGIDLTPRTGTDRVADMLASEIDRDLVIAVAGPTPAQTEAMRARYPGWQFVHIETPERLVPNSPEWVHCVERASASDWQILLSCLSFPKQELFANDVRATRSGGGVILCVGSAVDFLSGTHQRAPQAFQRFGLEWLHRLLTNPRRLWRRYLVEGPRIFLLYVRKVRAGEI